jgi:hypothetical protein
MLDQLVKMQSRTELFLLLFHCHIYYFVGEYKQSYVVRDTLVHTHINVYRFLNR